jgi:hypothetical protein
MLRLPSKNLLLISYRANFSTVDALGTVSLLSHIVKTSHRTTFFSNLLSHVPISKSPFTKASSSALILCLNK